MTVLVKTILSMRCILGEGLHWDSERNLLWFVGIHSPRIHLFNPESNALGSRLMNEPIGWLLSVENSDRMLIGLKSGIGLLDPLDSSASIEWVDRRFPADDGVRLNDDK